MWLTLPVWKWPPMLGDVFPLRGALAEEVFRTRRGVLVQSQNPEDLVGKFPGLLLPSGRHAFGDDRSPDFQDKVLGI